MISLNIYFIFSFHVPNIDFYSLLKLLILFLYEYFFLILHVFSMRKCLVLLSLHLHYFLKKKKEKHKRSISVINFDQYLLSRVPSSLLPDSFFFCALIQIEPIFYVLTPLSTDPLLFPLFLRFSRNTLRKKVFQVSTFFTLVFFSP